MKTMKKLASLLITLIMVMAMAVPAFAADVTITPKDNQDKHTYEAYQIFSGTLVKKDGKDVLSNIQWGSGVKGAELLADLKKEDDFSKCTSAADVANALKGFGDDADKTQAFAKVVGEHLTSVKIASNNNKISDLEDGYYLIKDKDDNLKDVERSAYTRFILKVLGKDVKVDAKSEVPTVEKKIVEGEEKVSVNEASIGDEIKFEVTSKVPDMTGYKKYYFVVNDTMSKGLTFTPNSVEVKIDGKKLESDKYTVTPSDYDNKTGTTIEIVFKDFIQHKDLKDKDIVITYNATLNKNAVIGGPNPNSVDLTYSNNPNVTDEGTPDTPDKPTGNSPTGKTPERKTETYTTELAVLKHDQDGMILTGAEFELTGDGVKNVITTKGEYVKAEGGAYWKLTDGTFTDQNPNAEGMDKSKYESITDKYKLDTKIENITKSESTKVKAFVDAKGTLRFTGLGAGTYTLKETTTPAGYNTIDDITFTVSFDKNTKTFSSDNENVKVGGDNKFNTTVVNNSGATLPSTGGIGTTIFYALGSIMVIAAGIVLVAKRRMKNEK